MIVRDWASVVKFLLLFRNTLITLHLALMHVDPNARNSLTYIDGHRLFNDLVIHMNAMKELSFLIETACWCNQQINDIIRSFQTGELINSKLNLR